MEVWQWASDQMIKFWWRSASRIRPYCDIRKKCLGRGMHYPSASSFMYAFDDV